MASTTNDERLTAVEDEKKVALSDNEKLYNGLVDQAQGYYDNQIDAVKDYAETQKKNQQAQTDFTIKQVNQQKNQAKSDYIKEQSGAYTDWQKQSNQYGVNAEQRAEMGMQGTGYSESSQVRMYNTYQMRVASARETYNRAVLNYDNAIQQARLQNNAVLAEIAYNALQKQLELSLQGFQYKNTLILEKAKTNREIDNTYHNRYLSVLDQINKENTLEEQKRQFNETHDLQERQFAWQKEQASLGSSGGSGGGSSGSRGSSGNSRKRSVTNSKAGKAIIEKTTKQSSKGNVKGSKSSDPTPDMASVLKLGYGPISATRLNELIKQGLVTEYEQNGKLKYKRSGLARKGGTYMR